MVFESYSYEHLFPWLIFALFTYGAILFGKKLSSDKQKMNVAMAISLLAWAFMFIQDIRQVLMGTYSVQEDLPLFLCRLVAWLLPLALYIRNWSFIRMLYFWVLAGTFQAVLTPDLEEGFPRYEYFRYFFLHFGLIAAIVYTIVVFKIRIGWKDFFNALIWAQFYLIFLMVINYFLGSNYGYTLHKPPGESILDLFGGWPWYVLGGELLMAIFFLVLMVPFLIGRLRKGRVEKSNGLEV